MYVDKNCYQCRGDGMKYLCDDVYVRCECRYEIIANMKILFGKHKGTYYKNIPKDYLKWCYNKEVFLTNNKDIHDYIYDVILTESDFSDTDDE